mmetsp:Transcript_3838/g.3734  ORF Transcript_3838/g.3734 Transcript_3838/m.3734 type:complete len:89 (+) Transcript_3838:359-625(+)
MATLSLMKPAGILEANQLTLTNGVLNSKIKKAGTHGIQKGVNVLPNTMSADTACTKKPAPNKFMYLKQTTKSHTKYPTVIELTKAPYG